MAYQKTNWQNGVTPLSAANMNKIEQGIEDAAEREELNSHKAEKASDDVHGISSISEQCQDLYTRMPFIDLGFSEMLRSMNYPNVTISSNTTLTNIINTYNNLTINASRTLSVPDNGLAIIIVKGTLSLNGIISAAGKGGVGGAETQEGQRNVGGSGGGVIILFANQIIGAGIINANGSNAVKPTWNSPSTQSNGKVGSPGRVFFQTLNAGAYGMTNSSSGAGGSWAEEILNYIEMPPYLYLDMAAFGGAGGGSGACDASTSNGWAHGGGGGSGCGGSGGRSGSMMGQGYIGIGGSGGGGGGLIIIKSNVIPAITLTAVGGNGSQGSGGTAADGGGGGGGGLVLQIANNTTANVIVTGGSGGAAFSTYGVAGVPGSPGITKLYQI